MNRPAKLAALPFLLTLIACGGSTLESLIPPTIVNQPSSISVNLGSPASFLVVTSGSSLSFQWQKLNGSTWQNVSGQTSNTFLIASTVASDGGTYRVLVTNTGGTATSNQVNLNFSQSAG